MVPWERAGRPAASRPRAAAEWPTATPPEVTEAAITVRGLRKSYRATEVLRGIDFEVQTGEVFGFLGPNGAGKTTTIEILEEHARERGRCLRARRRPRAA